jgi:hypothetical protein
MLQDNGLLPTEKLPRVEALLKRIASNWKGEDENRRWHGYRHARIWCRLVRRNLLNRGILCIGENPTGYELFLN